MGIFNWKAIATVFILLGIIMVVLSTSPTVSGFFVSMKDRLFDLFDIAGDDQVIRNVSFSVTTTDYGPIIFTTNRPINISLDGDFSGDVTIAGSPGNVKSSSVRINNFMGSGRIESSRLNINGDFSSIITTDLAINVSGTVSTDSSFNNLVVKNLGLARLQVQDASGSVYAKGNEIKITEEDLDIVNPLGTFEFDNELTVKASASTITGETVSVSS